MLDLAHSPLFTPYTNPESGVTIYILTHKIAPVQESFYFVNKIIFLFVFWMFQKKDILKKKNVKNIWILLME